MSWAIGHDDSWHRDIGYGVPALCDYPDCGAKIDRGLSHVCGGEPYGGDEGCGLYFCGHHLNGSNLCQQCAIGAPSFEPTPDVPDWIHHKLTDPSWQQWRDEHPDAVRRLLTAQTREAP